ncbi:GH25 family lysozyme [Streptomyces sp. BE20]|uniref:GH25 family lysozyme n=1 Tax=unclassified Streptomyces TaxID=2593676 RepID=UPI002E795224|nr:MULTISPECIES: GH25 family lysozyme [unclassified Streptomyces]MED7947403.1 GH25 family lysozyme [Streptomyces sp. BE303]MEE1820796.1 GH25 family lysozyme [Streptomyces sp. BE20]
MTIGAETSTLVSLSSYGCLKANGYSEAIIRAYQTVARVDPNFTASARNAQDAGLAVDALIQATTQAPATAAADVAQYIKDAQLTVGTTWLSVEAAGHYWSADKNANRTVLNNLVTAGKAAGLTIGIYTSADNWAQTFGADFTDHSALPLLYAHFDGLRDFKDFTPFGGWTSPARKAYNGGLSLCGAKVESYTWRP